LLPSLLIVKILLELNDYNVDPLVNTNILHQVLNLKFNNIFMIEKHFKLLAVMTCWDKSRNYLYQYENFENLVEDHFFSHTASKLVIGFLIKAMLSPMPAELAKKFTYKILEIPAQDSTHPELLNYIL